MGKEAKVWPVERLSIKKAATGIEGLDQITDGGPHSKVPVTG
jgi:hypothetical protein